MDFKEIIKSVFGMLAFHIASHPWKVCFITFLLNGLLGLGMFNLQRKNLRCNDIEEVYMPRNPPTLVTEKELLKLFPDHSGTKFYTHQVVKQPMYAELIVWRCDKHNLINNTFYDDLTMLIRDIKNNSVLSSHGYNASYIDICARRNDKCVINGEEIIEQLFQCTDGLLPIEQIKPGNFTVLEDPLFQLGDFKIVNNTVIGATYVKLRFNLRQDTSEFRQDAQRWMGNFINRMKEMSDKWFSRGFCFTFSHPLSYLEELDNDTYPDIPYFSFVFTIYFFYIGFVMSGGNILTKRVNIGRMGILVTPTSVLGAWGLLMACEIKFTNAIGIAPLFIVGHQIINTMITLSHLSDVNDEKDPRKRVVHAVKMSAIPITTTTLCHVVPFALAIISRYYALELIGIYIVTTTMFNYVNHFLFFTSCLAIHERRIDAGLHCCICTKLRPREELEDRSCCIICCCSGNLPTTRTDTESSIQKISRTSMLRFMLTTVTKCFAIVSYLILMAFGVWGLINYKVDVLQKNEVLPASYFYDWNLKSQSEFKTESIIQFVVIHPSGYANDRATISDLKSKLELKSHLQPKYLLSWTDLYDESIFVNYTTELALCKSLENNFLPNNIAFTHDILFDKNNSKILATRFYIKTKDLPSTKSLISLKKELFDLADEINELFKSNYDNFDDTNENLIPLERGDTYVFVYSPDFLHIDEWMESFWEFLRFSGIQLVLLLFLLFIIKPTWSSLILPPVTYLSMTTALFGISHFVGIYLTQISMIMYIIGGSFFVEVIVHSFYSYFNAPGLNNAARVHVVLSTSSQSLFHAIFGQFLGLLVLFVVKSYVFVTVFRITLLTTAICVLFAILWIPTLLSFCGQRNTNLQSETLDVYVMDVSSMNCKNNTANDVNDVENPNFLYDSDSQDIA